MSDLPALNVPVSSKFIRRGIPVQLLLKSRAAFFAGLDDEEARAAVLALDGEELGTLLDLMWGPLGMDFGDALLMLARCFDVPAAWILRAELAGDYTAAERARLCADALKNLIFREAVTA